MHTSTSGNPVSSSTNRPTSSPNPPDSRYPFRHSFTPQHPALFILDLHIVVILGPVVSDEQQLTHLPRNLEYYPAAACRKSVRGLMVECSRPSAWHDIPPAMQTSWHAGGGTVST